MALRRWTFYVFTSICISKVCIHLCVFTDTTTVYFKGGCSLVACNRIHQILYGMKVNIHTFNLGSLFCVHLPQGLNTQYTPTGKVLLCSPSFQTIFILFNVWKQGKIMYMLNNFQQCFVCFMLFCFTETRHIKLMKANYTNGFSAIVSS